MFHRSPAAHAGLTGILMGSDIPVICQLLDDLSPCPPMQDIAVKLRIPQRKPWSGMAQSLDAAAKAAADQEAMLVGVLPPYRAQAEEMVTDIQQGLDRWVDWSAS